MANWVKTILISDLISEDQDRQAIVTLADGLEVRLAHEGAPMRKITKAKIMSETDPETALLVINDGLNEIYDWADAKLIWLN